MTIRGKGRGGPNQEYALALAIALAGMPGIAALAADTDGTDGGAGSADDPAGAFVDGTTAARARALGLDPAAFLADNNSTDSSRGSAICLSPARPTPTSTTSAPSSLTGLSLSREILAESQTDRHVTAARSFVRDLGCASSVHRAARRSRYSLLAALPGAWPTSGFATTPAAASASRSATRTPKAGSPKAGGISPRASCETLLRGGLVARYYYIYAVDYDRGGEWSGHAFMCSRDKEFTIRGTDDCLARGYDRTGFFEVDTGEQRSWTVQLTDSAEQPRAPPTPRARRAVRRAAPADAPERRRGRPKR